MKSAKTNHDAEIFDQFSRQAKNFSSVSARTSEDALQLLTDTIGIEDNDEVLDVACGPGIVSCWLAKKARRVTGVDLVPAMVEEGRRRQVEAMLDNLTWMIGDFYGLPFADDSFSVVVTRYSFHHLLEPQRALGEMKRVCQPGGRICIADVTPDEGKTEAYDQLEKLRDPSHVHALCLRELLTLADNEQLPLKAENAYRLEISLDAQLSTSFPAPGHSEIIRGIVRQDIGENQLSVDAFENPNGLFLRIPVSICVWTKT